MIHAYCVDHGVSQNVVRTVSQVRFGVSALHHRHFTRKMTSSARHLLRKEWNELTGEMMRSAFNGIRSFGLNP